MEFVNVNFDHTIGRIKPMHAVNNGPLAGSDVEQVRSNFDDYKAAGIPYARNHDASFCSSYGGEHTVDVHAVFPDFSKNPYDPRSYDFALTDDYLATIVNAGTKVFYRLGSKIEHWRKKYGTIVPADFRKWAVVCEHIVRHYTLGWADGFHYDVEYWEIWNEPDGVKTNGDQPNWSGTPEQFYELYITAATHLKKCFPALKIGGPALSWVKNEKWLSGFLKALTENGERAPLDFFSWHAYPNDPESIRIDAEYVRKILDEAGFVKTESILNEWNYMEGWTDRFVSTILGIIGMRGSAFTAAAMTTGQKTPIDMMMYYDARVNTVFNGMFDLYTMKPLKGYYPFVMFSALYKAGNEAESTSSHAHIHVVAATGETGKAAMITYYSPEKDAGPKEVAVRLAGGSGKERWQAKILDKDRTMETLPCPPCRDGSLRFELEPDSVLFLSDAEA